MGSDDWRKPKAAMEKTHVGRDQLARLESARLRGERNRGVAAGSPGRLLASKIVFN